MTSAPQPCAGGDLVPPALLEPSEPGRCDRAEAAPLLDGYLRRLARQEACGRRVLGVLAAAFLRQHGQHALGFARVGDYGRERLGLSARELQSVAYVATRMAALPEVEAAFGRGELSWTQARLLAGVATPETASEWVETALGRTVRALEAVIARKSGRRVERDDTIDDEPRVRIRLSCPRHVRAKWHALTVLGRAVAGSELAPWQVADAVAAEGFSARGIVPEDPMPSAPDPEAIDDHETRAAFGTLDWGAVDEAAPADLERLTEGVGSLDAFALDRRMRAVLQAVQRIDWQTGRLLRTFFALRLHRLLRFPSAAAYVRERLGISPRKVRALVALERKLGDAPALEAPYRDGVLSWLRALAIMPVVSEATAPAWVARAQAVTVRRLVDEVEWVVERRAAGSAKGSDGPPPPRTPLVMPEWQMRAHEESPAVDERIVFFAPASLSVLLRGAIGAFTACREPRWRGLERLIDHVHAEWNRPPKHRDPIFARDGWRCAVPACTSRRNLHDHHLLFRSRGGGNARDNRITVCAWHHLRGIHQGRVRAWGTAPGDITWELGVRAGCEPLLRLRGDEYVVD